MKLSCVKLLISCLLFAAVGPATASAEQFVVLDMVVDATANNTTNSEFRVEPAAGIPTNWRTPIDYAMGTSHVRFEVLAKPSAAPTMLNVCFRNPSSYACMKYSPTYTATGVYNYNDSIPMFWQSAMVDWAMGVNQVMLVIKDEEEVMVHANPDFYPYKMRITITVVSPGGTYVPPNPGMPAAGAGGRGGSGGAGGAGAGGRGGTGGASAMAGRGGAGGMAAPNAGTGGAAGMPAGEAGSGSDPEPEPSEPGASMADASVPVPEPGDDEDPPRTPGQLGPQPIGQTPNKRKPPPGGIEGNCAVGGPGLGGPAGAAWLLGVAVVVLVRRRRSRG